MAQKRIDSSGSLAISPLPNGGFRVDARTTRVGVLSYRMTDGSIRRELRHPEDVFSADSLASYRDAAVTVGHPSVLVDAANWRQYSAGHMGPARVEHPFVSSELAVQDGEACRRVALDSEDPEALRDCSLGYTCDVQMGAGVWEGEPYDARQRNIRVNHVALLRRGEGRAGTTVGLRLDAATSILGAMKTHKIDGVDYEAGSDAHVQAVDKTIANMTVAHATEKKRADEATKRADAAEKAASPAAIAALVEQRSDLLSRARSLFGAAYGTGQRKDAAAAEGGPAGNDDAIIVDILSKSFPSLDLTAFSHDQLMAILAASASSMAEETAEETPAAPPEAAAPPMAADSRRVPRASPGAKPAATVTGFEKARKDARERNENRWAKGLSGK